MSLSRAPPDWSMSSLAKGHYLLTDFAAGAVAPDQMEVDPDRAHHPLSPHPILFDLNRLRWIRFWGFSAGVARSPQMGFSSQVACSLSSGFSSVMARLPCDTQGGSGRKHCPKRRHRCSGGRGTGLHPEFPLPLDAITAPPSVIANIRIWAEGLIAGCRPLQRRSRHQAAHPPGIHDLLRQLRPAGVPSGLPGW